MGETFQTGVLNGASAKRVVPLFSIEQGDAGHIEFTKFLGSVEAYFLNQVLPLGFR